MSLRALTLAILALAANILAAPSHGPTKGYLVISGGGPGNGMKEFLQLAGGPNARIVVIPTAYIVQPASQQELDRACALPDFAKVHCAVIHTTDPKVADTDAFVKPLLDATGVWLEGGRHWRLADAYLNTRTLKELFNLLDRGGVIGGGSAGATIQGSYMVRGSSHPDDNTIMMAPGHEVGFGLFTNVTIDQHVDARNRENDLAPVMKAHPELLGLGLDQNCSITVHGDGILVNGPQRVAVWDGKEHDGKGFYYLHAGDKLNTVTRVATIASAPPPGSHQEISLPKETLTAYVGVYQMRPGVYMTISLDGNQMLSQLANQPKVPIFAESPTMFFTKVVEAQLEFVKDAEGKPTTLILHQNGADRPMKRLDDGEAKRVADEAAAKAALAAQRYKDQKPDSRSEAAIRRDIEELRTGEPKYELMSEQLAEATRRQLPGIEKILAELGALESVTFKSVAPNGADIYDVKFEHGSTEWRITMLPDGKIEGVGFRRQ
jgi:cyanophycinase